MTDEITWVRNALREECLSIFGSTWSNDNAERLAKRAILAVDQHRALERKRTCRHPRQQGSGSLSSDGSSAMKGFCPDCGATWEHETPPREKDTAEFWSFFGSIGR